MEISISIGGFNLPKTDRSGKGKSRIAFPKTYCVVDTETTGLSPRWDNIIEIGAIRYEGEREVERFQTLVQPPVRYEDGTFIDGFIEALTGITNEMLENAPSTDVAIKGFDAFLRDDIIMGYYVGFDVNFLYDCYERYLNKPLSNDYIDILRFSRKLYPKMEHHRLRDMVELFGISNDQAHRSISDVLATKQCYDIMYEEIIRQYTTKDAFIDAFKRKYKYRPGHGGGGHSCKASDIVGDETKHDPESPLYNRYCVFTGKLEKFTRKEAMQIVANLGGKNEDNVTKKTNYLVLGNNDYCSTIKDGKSNKQKKAENSKLNGQDIEIIPETVFYDMIGEMLWPEEMENGLEN